MRTSISLFVALVLVAFVCHAKATNATTEDDHHDGHDDDHHDENTTTGEHEDHGDHDHEHDDDHHDETNDGAGTSSAPMIFWGPVAITAAYGFWM